MMVRLSWRTEKGGVTVRLGIDSVSDAERELREVVVRTTRYKVD